jgi:hypothetical protein
MWWVGHGYYGGGGGAGRATEAEMKIQAHIASGEVFIFIRESHYFPHVDNPSESAIYLSKDQAKEFAEELLRRVSEMDL